MLVDDEANLVWLLMRTVAGQQTCSNGISRHPTVTASDLEHPLSEHHELGSAQNPQSEILSADGYDGALLLEGQGGQSRWVSSLHYSLLADEIRDVKMLLGGRSGDASRESLPTVRSESDFPFTGPSTNDLRTWAPPSSDTCLILLDTFYSNVDPMTRIVHKPTLRRRLIQYIDYTYDLNASSSDSGEFLAAQSGEDIRTFEPLALAVFYSAINSLSDEDVLLQFSVEKEVLLSHFQHGVQVSLGRENFLATPSIEVLQAFILLLTCQSRENDMAKTWILLGLAHKLALSQDLHREASLFTYAESRGQEPTISDEDFTTFLPRIISDEKLVEGSLDETYTTPGFTDMTVHLIRLYGHHCFRRIIRGTYKLERMTKSQEAKNNDDTNPVAKLQSLFEEVRGMVDEMVNHSQTHYLQYCSPHIPEQRMTIGLATVVKWRCWSIFWLRTPKQYRESVITPEVRQMHALRSRALDALKKTMLVRRRDATPMWNAMNHIISNCLAKPTSEPFPVTPFQAVPTDLPTAIVASAWRYNNLRDDAQQPVVEEKHIQNLANLFVRHNAHRLLGIHLIHGHFEILVDTVLNSEESRGLWAKTTPIEQIDRSAVHGPIFVVGQDGLCAYEYQESPLSYLSSVGRRMPPLIRRHTVR
ncbi:C6 transcription factor [Fusarium agapanthi]|uniref:C6 transcription factor n=1 Tax=Fusarium agapanthi TaxID=1803897 RepID=A0A9P5BG70_9HYPO|nr:C6 transcription factor [Fusarium agapanthi]